jgi:hypothetical protein
MFRVIALHRHQRAVDDIRSMDRIGWICYIYRY